MSPDHDRLTRRLLLGGLLAGGFFLATAAVLQFTRGDLIAWQHTLSHYLHGPGGIWLCLAYVALGAAMAGMGVALRHLVPQPVWSGRAVLLCLAVAGLGLAGVAVGDRLQPPAQVSRPGLFHHLAAYAAFVAALLALLLQTLRFARLPDWRALRLPALLGTATCWALALIHIGRLPWLPRGGGQKLLIAALVCCMFMLALALLLRLSRQQPVAASRPLSPMETPAMIQRFDCGPRLAEMTIHNGVAYLAGQIPEDTSADISGQTAQVLADIDALLERAGTSKENILRAEIFLADINDAPGMNVAWDAWVPAGHAPARATVEAKLVNPGWKVEIVVTAAIV